MSYTNHHKTRENLLIILEVHLLQINFFLILLKKKKERKLKNKQNKYTTIHLPEFLLQIILLLLSIFDAKMIIHVSNIIVASGIILVIFVF